MTRSARALGAALPILLAALSTSGEATALQNDAAHQSGAWVLSPALSSAGHELRATRHYRSSGVPPQRSRAWTRFDAATKGGFMARWDAATSVPTRIWGRGIAAPLAMAQPLEAEKVARALIRDHRDLFAPGTQPGDLKLVTNTVEGGQRIVAFQQRHQGLVVLGGQLSFRFKNDRLFVIASEIVPVSVTHADAPLDQAEASKRALDWVTPEAGHAALEGTVEGPFVLPLAGARKLTGARVVWRATVRTQSPHGLWSVYLDATTGEPVARHQEMHFAQADLKIDAPERYPSAGRADYPAVGLELQIGGQLVVADDAGVFLFDDAAGSPEVSAFATSATVDVRNEAGPEASLVFTPAADGSTTWSAADDPAVDAQLVTYVHTHLAKDFARSIKPTMKWPDEELKVKVNLNDSCNAFYDGTINFFRSTAQCENTGRIADVVYHEFGHGFHHRSIVFGAGAFDSSLSEGVSDYYAATMTNDSAMGRGFFYSEQPLRQIDPAAGEWVWPKDIGSDPHQTGLIIGGALWDLRKALIDEMGEAAGIAHTDLLFAESVGLSSDIPSMYVEMLAADDDDGNLENGTPHVCAITEAFGRHGLRSVAIESDSLAVEPATQEGHRVSVSVRGLYAQCASDTVSHTSLSWRLKRSQHLKETLDMTGGPTTFEGTIPEQDAGEVVEYQVRVTLAVGSQVSFPDNAADPYYQFFVGDVEPLYCTDFETDPELDGWTHGLTEGLPTDGADDWQWGVPQGTSTNGDPSLAFSGERVFGNDLGGAGRDGLYQSSKTNFALSPVVDVGDARHVRLQYRRWLNVEDGYFDRATILVGDDVVWDNHRSANEQTATVHHQDREWRFHDLDLDDFVGDDGTVQVKFEIDSDQGLEMGGWNLDDFCIVAYDGSLPGEPECGNGLREFGEDCDDGNTADGDGCSALCASETLSIDPSTVPAPDALLTPRGGCACKASGAPADEDSAPWAWLALGALVWGRRRRRAAKP